VPSYVLVLEPMPGVEGIRALRRAIKSLRRWHGLRVVDLREQSPTPQAERQAAFGLDPLAVAAGFDFQD
jgi:hypothetical protein